MADKMNTPLEHSLDSDVHLQNWVLVELLPVTMYKKCHTLKCKLQGCRQELAENIKQCLHICGLLQTCIFKTFKCKLSSNVGAGGSPLQTTLSSHASNLTAGNATYSMIESKTNDYT